MTKALENGKAGLADATQETPSPDTVTGLVEELRGLAKAHALGSAFFDKENARTCSSAADALEAKDRELAEARAALADPIAVHINMMRGTVAKPSLENVHHLYPEIREEAARVRHALRECQFALAMMIAPDAIKQTTAVNAFAAAVAAEARARSVLSPKKDASDE